MGVEMSIASLIEVFRMEEIEKKTRASVIIKLGVAINSQFGSNVTEPIVYELVKLLDPDNSILTNHYYMMFLS
jgi:hypothetical protein